MASSSVLLSHGDNHGLTNDSSAQPTPRRPSRPQIDTGLAVQNQITPPYTPVTQPDEESGIVFHNYLRAFHDFDPLASLPANDDALLMTASIRAGDLILVHTIHANGWADGTVLSTGERGWLPTNYCEPYDHSYLRNLLNALCQFWDLLGGNEDANLSTFVRQDYVRGLIAGVRYLLEHADCLHREAGLVQKHAGIRRMRKGLLADLSSLVQLAKRLQETISEPFTEDVVHNLLDDLMTKAFKVVTRAVGFVDIWSQESAQDQLAVRASTLEPVTPPVDSAVDVNSNYATTPKPSMDHARQVSHVHSITSPTLPSADPESRRSSVRDTRPLSQSIRARKGSVAHRVSVIVASSSPSSERDISSTLASQQLAKAHDFCISHIGAFIGHHLHSRPSSELAGTTDNLVKACQKLLAIVEEVCQHDPKGSMSIQLARASFQSKLDEAARSTKDVFRFFDQDDSEAVMLPDTSNHLVSVGTALIRTAGECVAKTRSLIEQIGDFELSQPPSPMLTQGQASQASPSQSPTSPTSPEKLREHRMSSKALPPPPPIHAKVASVTVAHDFAASPDVASPITPFSAVSTPAPLSGPLVQRNSTIRASQTSNQSGESVKSPRTGTTAVAERKASVGCSIAGSTDTVDSNARDSGVTTVSEVSTRATTPDHNNTQSSTGGALLNSFASLSSLQSTSGNEAEADFDESQLLQRTYANELMLNKDGQVSGGSLPALVEQLTTHDSAPDAAFVSAFYITFRQFAKPRELAQALTDRFDYIGDGKTVGAPVRLRIFNAFKNWLETYWNPESDKEALGDIRYFALHKLKPHLPSAGDRLVELTRRKSESYANMSAVGKASTSVGLKYDASGAPEPIISKSQLNALRLALSGGAQCAVIDFDPMELARQMTLLASKIYCDIHQDELVGLEWTKKGSSKGQNVRNLCGLNTDLAHVVGDSILTPENAKQRALVIKQWAKVAKCCLDLNNYETVMAIMCSLNSSVVQRLKRTWQLVSKKTFVRLEELNAVVDFSGNQRSLRRRLENPTVPCLPFLGIYLTDLTFVDAGNPKTRELPGGSSETGEPISVINFDKHMRTAKIISHLQRFQVPYQLQAVPELQSWMEVHMERMRACNDQMVGNFHRRSLVIEPKLDDAGRSQSRSNSIPSIASGGRHGSGTAEPHERPKTPAASNGHPESAVREKFGTFFKQNAFAFKSAHAIPSVVHEEVPSSAK